MTDTDTKPAPPPAPEDKAVTTKHSITLNGQELNYEVTAGTLVLKAEDAAQGEKPKASIFYVSYRLVTDGPASRRPITYSFNGGPGSSSVWMHLGVLGPKRVLMDDEGMPFPPPYELVDNPFSILPESDLVFIDPVSTGYSRAVPGEKAEEFHGVKPDIESVGDFIQLWTTRNRRWASPKFLIGESYGTTRASGLAEYLQQRHGLYLNGIMLISSVLNFLTLSYDSGNDLPYPMLLPSFTATAWYHKRLAPELQTDLQQTLREAEQFAGTDYTLALMKGSAISPEERQQTIRQLSRYLGLSERFLHDHDMRVNTEQFCKELLRDQSLTVGRLDSRFTGQEKDNAADYPERDPSYSAILGPYTGAFYDYVRGELKFEKDLPYEIIKRLGKWQMEEGNYTNVSDALRNGFFLNPSLRVLVACGLYDLATPYFAAEYTINHLSLPPNLAERITTTYYPSGHMMYLHLPSLEKLSADLKEFIAASLPQR